MKKLLSLALALVLVFSMASCSLFGSPEEEATEAAESFMDAVVALEFDKLHEYVVDSSDLPHEVTELDMTANFEKVLSEVPPEMEAYKEDFKRLFDGIVDKLKSEFTYTVKEIEKVDSDRFTVTVTVNSPDFYSVDINSLFSSAVNEQVLADLISRMAADGKITESSTQQDILDALMPEVIKLIEATLDNITFDMTADDYTLSVVKADNGKWLIDVSESDF